MDHSNSIESVGTLSWDALVQNAIATSGVDGMAILDTGVRPRPVPHGLPALISALLHFLAPELPRRMRLYTYDVPGSGAVLEIRGARLLSGLPAELFALGQDLGVRIAFHRYGGSSSVLLTLPPNEG